MIAFVRDRTNDLQRLADDVRRERDLRDADPMTATLASVAMPRLVESIATTTRVEPACDPCRPATTAKHAA
jgi:hypothetical protein